MLGFRTRWDKTHFLISSVLRNVNRLTPLNMTVLNCLPNITVIMMTGPRHITKLDKVADRNCQPSPFPHGTNLAIKLNCGLF